MSDKNPSADLAKENLNQPIPRLAEQLIGFANESYVFSDFSRARPARALTAPERAQNRFAAETPSYFADVEPPPLNDIHLRNTRVVSSWEQMLPFLPRQGICGVLGAETGSFAHEILAVADPAKLILCDRNFHDFEPTPFRAAIQEETVELHEGDAAAYLAEQPDRFFHLISLRADHNHVSVARTLELAASKIKDDGWILCANYTSFAPREGLKSGVARAVNEFCHAHDFEIVLLALHPMGLQEVALRRRNSPPCAFEPATVIEDGLEVNAFLPHVWEYLVDRYEASRVLVLGSGAAATTPWFAERGLYALGVNAAPGELAPGPSNLIRHDYTTGPFVPSISLDLAWCSGLVEQIPEEYISNFMASFRCCACVCLAHASPIAEGPAQANPQSVEYWIRKMNENGFDCDAVETAIVRATAKPQLGANRTLTVFKRR
jgi:hypothetical protein